MLTIARPDAHFQAVFQGFLRKTAIDFSHMLATTNVMWANLAHMPFREIGRFTFLHSTIVLSLSRVPNVHFVRKPLLRPFTVRYLIPYFKLLLR